MKDLTPKQIERLAIKNREASRIRLKTEQGTSGSLDKPKNKVYVDRSKKYDPPVDGVSHQALFREMKKVPFSD